MTKITIVDRMEMGKEEDRDVQKKVHHFYSSVLWLHPGPVNPVSHPHQTMHPPTHKKKKRQRKHTKLTCSFHSEDLETILCEWGTIPEFVVMTSVSKLSLLVGWFVALEPVSTRWEMLSCWDYGRFVHQISCK